MIFNHFGAGLVWGGFPIYFLVGRTCRLNCFFRIPNRMRTNTPNWLKVVESTARKLGISGVFSTAVDPVRDQFDAGMNVKSEWWRKLVDVVRFGGFEGWEFI